jgi:hypothetical protein
VTSSAYDITSKSLEFSMYMIMNMPVNFVRNVVCKVINKKTLSRAETVQLCMIDQLEKSKGTQINNTFFK